MNLRYFQSVLHHSSPDGTFVFTDKLSVHKTFLPTRINVILWISPALNPATVVTLSQQTYLNLKLPHKTPPASGRHFAILGKVSTTKWPPECAVG